jgi:hypothetical protein
MDVRQVLLHSKQPECALLYESKCQDCTLGIVHLSSIFSLSLVSCGVLVMCVLLPVCDREHCLILSCSIVKLCSHLHLA